ncbi:hypothetical protein MMC12_002651 [Toensbergia leucococca]|nr:hypothetical protein [Toensbergia leucococca]
MEPDSKIREFPDIGSKLQAPTKKSVFERQKAEAEAKRQREQQETAAVYEDFVKSFDDENTSSPPTGPTGRPGSGFGGPGSYGPPSKRHFSGAPTGPSGRGGPSGGRGTSGPGSLGPPPPSLSRKRAFDGSSIAQRDSNQGLFAFEDSNTGPLDTKAAFQNLDDEEDHTDRARIQERAAPKPTLRLSSLPPGTSPAVIKSFLPANLNIDAVRILPPTGPGSMERRSLSALVTLAKTTPAIEIDTAVSALQNKYLGWGFYLTLSRHLSSAAVGVDMPVPIGFSSAASSLPFGARPIPMGPDSSLNRGPPPGIHRGGFAPPSSYAPSGPGQHGRGATPVQVNVNPPSDLKQLKLIHKTLEALLTHGPEFEALLMSRKDVQRDERWAWIWDSRSTGGVWYRWRLWEILTRAQERITQDRGRSNATSQYIFDGAAIWSVPEKGLPFEYTTRIEEFVSDSDYDSSEDEDSGDEGRRRHLHYQGGAPPPDTMAGTADGDNQAYLNPLQKAKLTHLLARLPNTNAKLRRGDVARVTAFAIQHAGEGAEEVVQIITSNVRYPFAFTTANPDRTNPPDNNNPIFTSTSSPDPPEKEDTSPSKLIALYIISDILSSSSTSGIRHAWRYRQLFEAALTQQNTFAHLGRLEKEMQWGRLRAEKWKRSVGAVLALWEGWCVFPQAAQESFAGAFANPPLTTREMEASKAAEKAAAGAAAGKSKWKTVDEKADLVEQERSELGVDREAMDLGEDLDGEPMDDGNEDVDGEPMEDSDEEEVIDNEAFDRNDDKASPRVLMASNGDSGAAVVFKMGGHSEDKDAAPPIAAAGARRRRPKAEDMFADSDDD